MCCTETAFVGQSSLKAPVATGGPNSDTQRPGAVFRSDVPFACYRAV